MEDLGIRRAQEELELVHLAPYAQFSSRSRGRAVAEPVCPIRTAFARDRDRILHSKAFRRLKHKTQVFIAPEGDHYRTRLTHTLDVAQIARTIARALRLNEDLVEAIAFGHDLGHAPFGHGGEEALNRLLPGGFNHSEQSLRVVDVLEGERGLNLCWEVRDGIRNHSGDSRPGTLEGRVVQLADRIAYINHDIDDALRAGVLSPGDIPPPISEVLGSTHTDRIDSLVGEVVRTSFGQNRVELSQRVGGAMNELRTFLFARVYGAVCPAKREQAKAQGIIDYLFRLYRSHPDRLPARYRELATVTGPPLDPELHVTTPALDPVDRAAADYVASMTDRYAIAAFQEQWIPRPWADGGRDA